MDGDGYGSDEEDRVDGQTAGVMDGDDCDSDADDTGSMNKLPV